MHKIPVGETISSAYGFAFAGFLTVLGTIWFPYVVLAAFSCGVIYLLAPEVPGHFLHGQFDTVLLFGLQRVQGLITLAALIITAVVSVGLQERALGRAHGPAFFYFSLGAPVWRMIGAVFLAIIALIFIAVITIGVAVALAVAGAKIVPHFGPAIAVIVGVVASCWIIYASVRLTFFLPAVVVAEEKIGLGRAWELGGGNFWRIIVVSFVIFVPVMIGILMIFNALVGPFIPMDLLSHIHAGMTPDEIGELKLDLTKRMLQEVRVAFPLFIAIDLIQRILFLGLANGAVGKAYLAVTNKG